jgi:hypothetical protein
MLSANRLTFDMTRLCGEGDGQLPSSYYACSKSCKAKFDGIRKLSRPRQTILRRARGSILGTEIAVDDAVYVFDDKTPNRFVEAGTGVVLRRQYNKATGQADLMVSSRVGSAVRTVGPSGLRLVKEDVDAPIATRTSPFVDGKEPASAPGRDASAAVAMASTRRRALGAEADAVILRRERDKGLRREEDLRKRLEAAESAATGAMTKQRLTSDILKSTQAEFASLERRLERSQATVEKASRKAETKAWNAGAESVHAARRFLRDNNDTAAARLGQEMQGYKVQTLAAERRAGAVVEELAAIQAAAHQASVQDPDELAAMDAPALVAKIETQRHHIACLERTMLARSEAAAATEAAATESMGWLRAFLFFEEGAPPAAKVTEALTAVQMQTQYIAVLEKNEVKRRALLAKLEADNVPWLQDKVQRLEEALETKDGLLRAAEAAVAPTSASSSRVRTLPTRRSSAASSTGCRGCARPMTGAGSPWPTSSSSCTLRAWRRRPSPPSS